MRNLRALVMTFALATGAFLSASCGEDDECEGEEVDGECVEPGGEGEGEDCCCDTHQEENQYQIMNSNTCSVEFQGDCVSSTACPAS